AQALLVPSCHSPEPSPGSFTPCKEVEEAGSMASDSSTLPRVTFQTPEKPEEESSHRKLGKLTIKYNRKDLQRWLELEEWINAQLQELYQYQVRTPEPEIDLEDLLEVPNEEQKLKLQVFISSVIWKRSSGVSAAYYLGIS
uniref:Protein phosphatase 1 regulatory subunit 14D n=1 Tax=Nothoprocta perdicaria TaxID=30464 RepID=A0A8C6YTA1_NOTPE